MDEEIIEPVLETTEETVLETTEEPVLETQIDYSEDLSEIKQSLNDINAYFLEQREHFQTINNNLESQELSDFETEQLLLLQQIVDSNTTEQVGEYEADYQAAGFYADLSILVILALITVAMTWKFVYSIFSTFVRHIG